MGAKLDQQGVDETGADGEVGCWNIWSRGWAGDKGQVEFDTSTDRLMKLWRKMRIECSILVIIKENKAQLMLDFNDTC